MEKSSSGDPKRSRRAIFQETRSFSGFALVRVKGFRVSGSYVQMLRLIELCADQGSLKCELMGAIYTAASLTLFKDWNQFSEEWLLQKANINHGSLSLIAVTDLWLRVEGTDATLSWLFRDIVGHGRSPPHPPQTCLDRGTRVKPIG